MTFQQDSHRKTLSSRPERLIASSYTGIYGAQWRDPENADLNHAVWNSSTIMPKEHEYWVYIMASLTGTLYVGMTNDIYVRVRQHKALKIEGFSKRYRCTRLVYYESYEWVQNAIAREKQQKKMASREEDHVD